MCDFQDEHVDEISKILSYTVEGLASRHQEYSPEAIAYALIEMAVQFGRGELWDAFLHEAVEECIVKDLVNNPD